MHNEDALATAQGSSKLESISCFCQKAIWYQLQLLVSLYLRNIDLVAKMRRQMILRCSPQMWVQAIQLFL